MYVYTCSHISPPSDQDSNSLAYHTTSCHSSACLLCLGYILVFCISVETVECIVLWKIQVLYYHDCAQSLSTCVEQLTGTSDVPEDQELQTTSEKLLAEMKALSIVGGSAGTVT